MKFSSASIVLLLSCFLFVTSFASCREKKNDAQQSEKANIDNEPLQTSYTLFRQEDGWGFDIYVNGEKYVHQPYIPAIQGNHPFKTEEDANKVAELMSQKIQGNIIPPSVTVDELKLLEIQADSL